MRYGTALLEVGSSVARRCSLTYQRGGNMCNAQRAEELAAENAKRVRDEEALRDIIEVGGSMEELSPRPRRGKIPHLVFSCASSRIAVHVAGSAGRPGVDFEVIR